VLVPLYVMRWSGVRTPSAVAGMVAACAVGGVFMPSYDDVAAGRMY